MANSAVTAASPGHGHPMAPLGGPLVTPVTLVLAVISISAIGILIARMFLGLGAVTNVSDGYPWGIWIVYDLFVGTAFACGG